MIKAKVILTDCDGVLLDWEYAFNQWMLKHGYEFTGVESYWIDQRFNVSLPESKRLVRMFNESAALRKIPPLRDAIKYVRKLHEEHGYIFHIISSMSDDEYAQHLRIKNLTELFGPTVFEKYIFLPCGGDKDEALEKYRDTGCYWIEDKMANAVLGNELGLDTILMKHDYNVDFNHQEIQTVNNWKEIYERITG